MPMLQAWSGCAVGSWRGGARQTAGWRGRQRTQSPPRCLYSEDGWKKERKKSHLGTGKRSWCTAGAQSPGTPSWWAPQPAAARGRRRRDGREQRRLWAQGGGGKKRAACSGGCSRRSVPLYTNTCLADMHAVRATAKAGDWAAACRAACLCPLRGVKVGVGKGGRHLLGLLKQAEAPGAAVEAQYAGAAGRLCGAAGHGGG